MFVAIVGIAILFHLALFVCIGIGEAMGGDWGPLIALGQGLALMVALVLLLMVPSLIMDAIRWARRSLWALRNRHHKA
jgi:hypothetical protein